MDFKETTGEDKPDINDLMSVNSLFTDNEEDGLDTEELPVETPKKKAEVTPIPVGSIPFDALKRKTVYRYAVLENGSKKMITGELVTKITHSPLGGMRLKIHRQSKKESEILDVVAVFSK